MKLTQKLSILLLLSCASPLMAMLSKETVTTDQHEPSLVDKKFKKELEIKTNILSLRATIAKACVAETTIKQASENVTKEEANKAKIAKAVDDLSIIVYKSCSDLSAKTNKETRKIINQINSEKGNHDNALATIKGYKETIETNKKTLEEAKKNQELFNKQAVTLAQELKNIEKQIADEEYSKQPGLLTRLFNNLPSWKSQPSDLAQLVKEEVKPSEVKLEKTENQK